MSEVSSEAVEARESLAKRLARDLAWHGSWEVYLPTADWILAHQPARVVPSAEEVLVWHQRTGPATCACGPMPLGSSHPAHQAQMLADAGLLATPVEPGIPPRSAERALVAEGGEA